MLQHIRDQAGIENERGGLEGYLVFLSSNAIQERIRLIKDRTVGGKHQMADIPLRGAFVGQNAFEIIKKSDGFFIKHAGGKRTTRVNGEAVSGQRALQDGDLITIGATKMQFCSKRASGTSLERN